MAQPSRTRRILKWTGVGVCVLIPVAWVVSVFAGVRIGTPIGSIALQRGVLEIVRSPPIAQFISEYASADAWVKQSNENLRKAEAEISANEGAARVKPHLVAMARTIVKGAEDGRAAHAAIWGIPIATTADQTLGILWLKPNGPRLSRSGLGLWFPTYRARGTSTTWPGVWIPLWVIALAAASSWGFLRWRRRIIPPGHCTTCGYDLTGNLSGVCPECGEKSSPPAGGPVADSECGLPATLSHEKSDR